MIDLSFLVPSANENRWSDLLATLIVTDRRPLEQLLGISFSTVRREVSVPGEGGRRSDRLDLLLLDGDAQVAAIEVKLFSDLGVRQLDRYRAAFPDAREYRVLHLASLPVNLQGCPPWTSLTWEAVIAAYSTSDHPWVAATALAWLQQLESLVPSVNGDTIWNDVPDDAAGFELALRARVSWLSSQMETWCELEHGLVQSSGGGNWAVRMWADACAPDHLVTAEMQEGLTAYEWKVDPERPYRGRLPGPVVLLGMRQEGPPTSADFDWALLHRMYAKCLVDDAGQPIDGRAWHTTAPRPTHPVDKQNWQGIVADGAPRWLGKGWGMRVAERTNSCLFGGRFGLSPDSTLAAIDTELRSLQKVIREMAATQ